MSRPNKTEVKRLVDDLLESAKRAEIAKQYGKSETWISNLLNPNTEHDGPIFSFEFFMSVLAEVDLGDFRKLRAAVDRFLDACEGERTMGRRGAVSLEEAQVDFNTEAGFLFRTIVLRKPAHEVKASAIRTMDALNRIFDAVEALQQPTGAGAGARR